MNIILFAGKKNKTILIFYTMVANRTFSGVKPSISTSNVALYANPETVLNTAEDFKTPPTC